MNPIIKGRTRSSDFFFVLLMLLALNACNKTGHHQWLTRKQMDSLNAPVDFYASKGNVHMAIMATESTYRAQKIKTDQIKLNYYAGMSAWIDGIGKNDSALIYADSAILIADKHPLTDTLWQEYYISAHYAKGSSLFTKGSGNAAIDELFKAREQADKLADPCKITFRIYHFMAMALYRQKRYAEAKDYFKRTLNIVKGCSVKQSKIINNTSFDSDVQEQLSNIALCYTELNKKDSARIFYDKALRQIAESERLQRYSKDTAVNKLAAGRNRAVVWGNIAQIMVKQNKPDSAVMFFTQSFNVTSKPGGDPKDAMFTQMRLAGLYLAQHKYAELKRTLVSLRNGLDTLNNEDALLGWKHLMYQYFAATNQPLQELKYYRNYIISRDSLATAKRESIETDINKALNDKSQKLQITVLQKNNQLSKIYLYITVALIALALAIIGLVYYNNRKGRANIQALTLLNAEISEQRDKIEFAMVELEKSNDDKKRILKIVAHDLRNPISGISTLSRSVIDDDLTDAEEKKVISLIEKAAQTSNGLISELLELNLDESKINLKKQPEDINEVIKHSVELMRVNAGKKQQEIQMLLWPDALIVSIDKQKFERVINNLLSNAMKFSAPGERINLSVFKKKAVVQVIVSDKGMGIPDELRENLFNVFTDARRKGTHGEKSFGLGLSICKQITEAHGGRIWVESQPGQGSSFYVELPGL